MTAAAPPLTLRWSHLEGSKSYARPFMVLFSDGGDHGAHGSVAVNGVELLYYRQFQAAVLQRTGELFSHPLTDAADDPQRSWLNFLGERLPRLAISELVPVSHFDEEHGRRFRFSPAAAEFPWAAVDGAHLLDYQEFQAVLAHQTGCLYRHAAVEAVDEDRRRQAAWSAALHTLIIQVPSA